MLRTRFTSQEMNDMALIDIERSVLSDAVDLDGLEGLLRYLAIGFTPDTKFRILKTNDHTAEIPKSEADRLKSQFFRMFGGKPKSYLRSRIPILVLGIVMFSDGKARGQSLNDRLSAFAKLIQDVDSANLSNEDLVSLRRLVGEGLDRLYYTQYLNSALDPFASFFDGQTPRSFSNAVQECVRALDSQGIQKDPTISVVEDPKRNLRLLGEDERVYTRLDEPLPDVSIIDAPGSTAPPEVTGSVKSANVKNIPNFAYGAIGAFAGFTLGYFIRKASK